MSTIKDFIIAALGFAAFWLTLVIVFSL